jgi:hypothetical protein
MKLIRSALAALVLAGAWGLAQAKPIAFSHGTTVMAEYGAGTMNEAQVFYAPAYFVSVGAGYIELESDLDSRRREIIYARVNLLAKRWNMETAQANIFAWGGVGEARVSERDARTSAWNAGAQIDYETRRVYFSTRTDLHRANAFSHRIDTLQLGIAPYEHDFDTLATWFVVQGRRISGGIHHGTEWALLLRLFKRGAWIEAGATVDGRLQAMFMANF